MHFFRNIYNGFRRSDGRYFRTQNLHLATVLFAQGFELVNIDRSDPWHCQFVFRKSSDLEALVGSFEARESIKVDAHQFIAAWKFLRTKLAGERF